MPQIYEVWNMDRYNAGLRPYKYSGSDYNDNPLYLGSSKHKDYKNHCKSAHMKKYCLLSINKQFISSAQLRTLESMIQRKENHAACIDYYNMTNIGQPDPGHPETRKKISDTLKLKDVHPNKHAIAAAHTKSACIKRSAKMEGYKWFYNPGTLKSMKCLLSDCPDGFIPGKKIKKMHSPKKTRDQISFNIQSWKIYKDGDIFWEGQNLKEYCRNNKELKWLFSSPTLSSRVKTYTEHTVHKIDGVLYLDGMAFDGTQKDLAVKLGLSNGHISTSINNTNIVRCVSGSSMFVAERIN